MYEIRCPRKLALAASQIIAGDTRESLLSCQNSDRLFQVKVQEGSFKREELNFQVGDLGMLNSGLIVRCTDAWSDKTIESMWHAETDCKYYLGMKK